MNRRVRAMAAYVLYPVCFLAISIVLWLIAGERVYEAVDAKICMLITNNAPNSSSIEEPIVLSISEKSEESDSGEYQTIVYGEQYGIILCREKGLKAPLYYGDDDQLLRLGAGQYKDSAFPGSVGTSIIGAHDTTFFAPLEDLVIGDQIEIQTRYGDFTYKVGETKIADAKDTSAYQLDGDNEVVILYTCYPFGQVQEEREQRYYIYCNRLATQVTKNN